MTNPLLDDELVDLLLTDVHDLPGLLRCPAFEAHDADTVRLFVDTARRYAREVLFPSYRALDVAPSFEDGVVHTHADLPRLYRGLTELGVLGATRPLEAGGQGVPQLAFGIASAYLMAGNLSVYGYAGLTSGAAHLIERFGTPELDRAYRQPMLDGRFTGTMALTEPQAGSSLADVTTRATPTDDGHYLIRGSKIFISGGDHTVVDNVIHLLLARVDGAPEGTRGISLFAVPKRRLESDGSWVDNDVAVSGLIHKIGWKALPSLTLEYGSMGDCRGWLVGERERGLPQMFQMMNEARLMVGWNAAATASVAYHEARAYALDRRQGRRGPSHSAPVPIVEHADVRRMLLRQKAIVEGALSLLAETARLADLSEHAEDEAERTRAQRMLDVLTPIAKSFGAEWGFEANALAVQVLGGYGYTSEYLPEAFLRDQKLNSIHEGTTGIQSLDLLGRKAVAQGGVGLVALGEAMRASAEAARASGVDAKLVDAFLARVGTLREVTLTLAARGGRGDVDGMLGHSADYLAMACVVCVAWQWLKMAGAVERVAARPALADGVRAACRYWIATELPRVDLWARLCIDDERSYLDWTV
ncbi:MAG: acyl-CoA dehydrogenase [Sandaracinaceae bacterium]